MSDSHDETTLLRTDLNLLVALDALLRERSVTRAAKRAGVSQSAMSHTLRRLRQLFDDPLLVRGRRSMVPTPRAEALATPLRAGLLALARALDTRGAFAAEHSRRRFRIASPDLFDVLVVPPLLERLRERAPGVRLAIVPMPRGLGEALETGELDLAVLPTLRRSGAGEFGPQPAPDLQRRVLLEDGFASFVRTDHPALARRRLSLAAFAELDHVLVSPSGEGGGVVDTALAAAGLERRVLLRVPTFAAALNLANRSPLVLTAPASLAAMAGDAGLARLKVPLELPRHSIAMLWHPRVSADAGHQWFRELLSEVACELPAARRRRRAQR